MVAATFDPTVEAPSVHCSAVEAHSARREAVAEQPGGRMRGIDVRLRRPAEPGGLQSVARRSDCDS